MFCIQSGPNYKKLSSNLRLVISRLKLMEKKKTEQAVKARKEIAEFLSNGKDERARIRVEHIIREDYLVEAMELIELYCDLLLTRIGLLKTIKGMDAALEEPIASIIWATPRLVSDIKELSVISDHLTAKYGKEFEQCCRRNVLGNVNEGLVHKLGVEAPPKILIEKYIEEISKTYNIPYKSVNRGTEGIYDELGDNRKGRNGGGGGNVGRGSNGSGGGGGGIGMPSGSKFPQPAHGRVSVKPNEVANEKVPELPSVPAGTIRNDKGKKADSDFEELSKRFEMLKSKT